ncbi:sensor histidine kinase [Thalassotalea euphylliae]|nr:histidine kinase [Thalassotalea euphylliae]
MFAAIIYTVIDEPRFDTAVGGTSSGIKVNSGNGDYAINKNQQAILETSAMFVFFTLWSTCYLVVTGRRLEQQMQLKLQEQQLENLKAQINPHFLFNSMNTIRALIYEDKDKAAEVITQLSELFRYNLSSANKSTVTLDDELTICQRYLAIEKSRLGERLNIEFEISPNLSHVQLPSMALFTLLENAVKHGIAPLTKGGTIKLTTTREQEYWLLTVTNPFCALANVDGAKLGLDNLRQRLTLMFGQSACINTRKYDNEYQAVIKIPYGT